VDSYCPDEQLRGCRCKHTLTASSPPDPNTPSRPPPHPQNKPRSGNYAGPEPERLATLKYAALLGAPYVDVEYKAAHLFFAGAAGCACLVAVASVPPG